MNKHTNFIKRMAEMQPDNYKGGLWHLIRFFLGMHMKPVPDKANVMKHLMLDSMQILTSYSFGSPKELKQDLEEIEVTRLDAQIATAFVCAHLFINLEAICPESPTPLKDIVNEDPFYATWPYKEGDE